MIRVDARFDLGAELRKVIKFCGMMSLKSFCKDLEKHSAIHLYYGMNKLIAQKIYTTALDAIKLPCRTLLVLLASIIAWVVDFLLVIIIWLFIVIPVVLIFTIIACIIKKLRGVR